MFITALLFSEHLLKAANIYLLQGPAQKYFQVFKLFFSWFAAAVLPNNPA
mgnify:CR=1 FL=1